MHKFEVKMKAILFKDKLVFSSDYPEPEQIEGEVVVPEVTITGSRCGPFAPALKLLEEGVLNIESMIEAEYNLEEYESAFSHASQPGALKVFFRAGKSH